MTIHLLDRTSPMGGKFIGRCRFCGIDGMEMADALKPCHASRDITQDDAVVMALETPSSEQQSSKEGK